MRMLERYITTFRPYFAGNANYGVFFLDDTAKWYFEINQRKDYKIRGDFASLALPYQHVYMEYPSPKRYRDEKGMHDLNSAGRAYACTGHQVEIPEEYGVEAVEQLWMEKALEAEYGVTQSPLEKRWSAAQFHADALSEAKERPCRWMTFLNLHVDDRKQRHVLLGGLTMYLDEHGRTIGVANILPNLPREQFSSLEAWEVGVNQLQSIMDFYFNCFLFSLSLIHCKNVTIGEGRLRKRRGRRRGHDGITYKTLELEPLKHLIRHEYEGEQDGEVGRALHVCRSHFRTYSEERPLFGKHSGVFWVPSHVRGTKRYGEVIKDYVLKADTA